MNTALVTTLPTRDALSLADDPAAYTARALESAVAWLHEARDADELREAKATAVGIEAFIRERALGVEAQYNASEIVTRCQREIARLERATVPARGEIGRGRNRTSPPEVLTSGEAAQQAKTLAEATDEQVGQAITDTRAAGKAPTVGAVVRQLVHPDPKRKPREPKAEAQLVRYLPDLVGGATREGAFREAVLQWSQQEHAIWSEGESHRTRLVAKSDYDREALLQALSHIHRTAKRLERQLNYGQ